MQQQVQSYLQPANPDPATMSPQDAQKAVATDLTTFAEGGADAPAAKARIIAIMAAQMKVSQAEATKKFDDTQAKLTQAKDQAIQKAKAAADASASAASTGSFLAFGTLLLGAIAAAMLRRRPASSPGHDRHPSDCRLTRHGLAGRRRPVLLIRSETTEDRSRTRHRRLRTDCCHRADMSKATSFPSRTDRAPLIDHLEPVRPQPRGGRRPPAHGRTTRHRHLDERG